MVFWPTRASSWNQISTSVPFGRGVLTFANSAAKPLFEGLHSKFVLGMVAGARRELDVALLLQLAPYGRFIERHRKLVVKPLDQVDQTPANDAMDRGDRTALDRFNKRPPLSIIEP